MRAQGKPDASRIRWPRTQKAERYELTSPQECRTSGFPCTTKDGKITIVNGLEIDAFSRERMTLTLNELNEEREGVKHLLT